MRGALWFVFLSLSSIQPLHGADGCNLKVGYSESYKPYQWHSISGDGKSIPTGLDLELISAIARRMKCDISLREASWSQLLDQIARGEVDVAGSASNTKERRKFAHFSASYREEVVVLFTRKGEAAKYALKQLKDIAKANITVGVEAGSWYGPEHFKLLRKNKVYAKRIKEIPSLSLGVEMLGRNDIQFLMGDPVVIQAILLGRGTTAEYEVHPLKVFSAPVHVIMSKKSVNAKRLAEFNAALAELNKNGELAQILKKYL